MIIIMSLMVICKIVHAEPHSAERTTVGSVLWLLLGVDGMLAPTPTHTHVLQSLYATRAWAPFNVMCAEAWSLPISAHLTTSMQNLTN